MLESLADRLARRPRAAVGIFPTPLQYMAHLSRHLQRPVYFKRDDLAGLAIGGSKVRILQYTAGDALSRGANLFVAGGYVQSNHPSQVAAVGCALGIPTEVILDVTKGYEPQGNILLLDLAGARVHCTRIGSYEGILERCLGLTERLTRRGFRPHLMTHTKEIHGLSVLAYAEGLVELNLQLSQVGVVDADVFVGSGGPTYAGLLLGALSIRGRLRVHGIPPHGRGVGARARVRDFVSLAAAELGLDIIAGDEHISLLGEQVGAYGFLNKRTAQAVRLVAQLEGVFLDPVYTGNAMEELFHWLEQHLGDGPIVFIHTGGIPTLFAYERELLSARTLKYASLAPRMYRVAGSSRIIDRGPKRRKVSKQ